MKYLIIYAKVLVVISTIALLGLIIYGVTIHWALSLLILPYPFIVALCVDALKND